MGERYNGWTNYETWCVNLWIDNSQGDQEWWHERARWCITHHGIADNCMDARCELAEALKDAMYEKYDEQKPESGILCDLLNAALSDVNWHELAAHYVDAVREEESHA